ncbi:site-determining protein [Geomonas limicola]|uniref:Site-determining protein n=1 Tax=Geomonas limicola TaxID=2740186 RepID=A0A6V8NE78_9BACT|nr:MinD/ParA family protein [Geomonas limicola]GFO70856.1 site-determining protein [Geomonas limicola]
MTASRGTTDQADMLRQLAGNAKKRVSGAPRREHRAGLRVISVTSGKAGVGKTSVTINLAEALALRGERVLVVDADHGLGDLCLQFGILPSYSLSQVLANEHTLEELLVDLGQGVQLLPAGTVSQQYHSLSPSERLALFQAMERLEEHFDMVLIDTGAGIPANVTGFASAAREVMLVMTPEATSITDAYTMVKTLSGRYGALKFKFLVNRCRDAEEGAALFRKLSAITGKFLEVSLEYAGCILHDELLVESGKRRGTLSRLFPDATVTRHFATLAQQLTTEGPVGAVATPLDPPAARCKEWRNHELSS